MTETLIYRAAKEAFDKRVRAHPDYVMTLLDAQRRLHDGRYDSWLADAIMCASRNEDNDLVEIDAFLQMRTMVLVGAIATCRIHVGSMPFGDAAVDLNQQALDENLPAPFKAKVRSEKGYSATCDGNLWWTAPITMGLWAESRADHVPWRVEPGTIELEIGSTRATRTLAHCLINTGVARWAYASNEIVLLLTHPSIERFKKDVY